MTAMRRKNVMKPQSSKPQQRSILDDGNGHVNPDLAATLWQWEQHHRDTLKLPKVSFSTRQGLRLVEKVVAEILQSPRGQRIVREGNSDIHTDLVQEGVMALMDALNDYRRRQQLQEQSTFDDEEEEEDYRDNTLSMASQRDGTSDDPNAKFEAFARPVLQDRLWSTLDKTYRSVQLPETESYVWKYVQKLRPILQAELGRPPTTQELAERLELPYKTLESLLAARRRALSVESTVEIKMPESLEDRNAHFTDYEDWEAKEGQVLGTDQGKDEVLVEEFQDEAYQYEGEDEMWIHQAQIAAPLREIIPDEEPSPDDMALSDMIRHDVGEFLTKTLTAEEVQVVRLSFGLDAAAGKAQSPLSMWEEIGYPMNMEPLQVKKVLRSAVNKLRKAYQSNYVESYLEGDRQFYGEDSV
jgi:DNA-directed RNA polymerase sigma subunit (sigma70/sigma32)